MALSVISRSTFKLVFNSIIRGFFPGAVHTTSRVASCGMTSAQLGSLFFFHLSLNQSGDHPQVVSQYTPGDRKIAVSKSFAS